ncbi:MAG TPA: PEP-CTERM sorting domain-containing protein [Bryobacteraceae bacterium]|nr:PEP-CTERM sorting domain-containing protein [Bryobacteraceae bacterium]
MNKIFRNFFGMAFVGCALMFSLQTASASVAGTLETGSTGTVTATIDSVIFNNDPAALGTCSPQTCDSDVATGTTLSFAGCSSGTLGTPGCLSAQEGIDVNSPITAASLGENQFMTFANNPNLVFSLTGIATFTNANCAGLTLYQSCVVFPGSPIILTLEPGNQTQVSLHVSGNVSDTGISGLATGSTYEGGFTQLLTNNLPNNTAPTPADIQLYFCGTNSVTSPAQCSTTASITSSQSGSFTATMGTLGVPEPSSLAMMLVGTALIGITVLRKRQSR